MLTICISDQKANPQHAGSVIHIDIVPPRQFPVARFASSTKKGHEALQMDKADAKPQGARASLWKRYLTLRPPARHAPRCSTRGSMVYRDGGSINRALDKERAAGAAPSHFEEKTPIRGCLWAGKYGEGRAAVQSVNVCEILPLRRPQGRSASMARFDPGHSEPL